MYNNRLRQILVKCIKKPATTNPERLAPNNITYITIFLNKDCNKKNNINNYKGTGTV